MNKEETIPLYHYKNHYENPEEDTAVCYPLTCSAKGSYAFHEVMSKKGGADSTLSYHFVHDKLNQALQTSNLIHDEISYLFQKLRTPTEERLMNIDDYLSILLNSNSTDIENLSDLAKKLYGYLEFLKLARKVVSIENQTYNRENYQNFGGTENLSDMNVKSSKYKIYKTKTKRTKCKTISKFVEKTTRNDHYSAIVAHKVSSDASKENQDKPIVAEVSEDENTNTNEEEECQPEKCLQCNITDTPEWRKGPYGQRTLCNACGLFFAKILRKVGYDIASDIIRRRRGMGIGHYRRNPSELEIEEYKNGMHDKYIRSLPF